MNPSDVFGTPPVLDGIVENMTAAILPWAAWIFVIYFIVLPLIAEGIRDIVKRILRSVWRWVSNAIWPSEKAKRPRYSTESYVDELRHEHGE